MSLQFHLFPPGTPPADTDTLLISRVDGTSPSGFSNFQLTWAQLKATVVGGSSTGAGTPGWDAVDGEDGFPIPGPRGADGIQTVQTTTAFVVLDADPGEDGFPIPGPQGPAGGGGGPLANIALSILAPITDETITAGWSAVVVRKFTIGLGRKLTIGLGARMRIL